MKKSYLLIFPHYLIIYQKKSQEINEKIIELTSIKEKYQESLQNVSNLENKVLILQLNLFKEIIYLVIHKISEEKK